MNMGSKSVCERERGERETECVCVCVCVCIGKDLTLVIRVFDTHFKRVLYFGVHFLLYSGSYHVTSGIAEV